MLDTSKTLKFDEIVENRIGARAKNSQIYRKAIEKEKSFYNRLMDSLETKEQRKTLLKLEEAWNEANSYFIEYTYLQGLEDSSTFSGPTVILFQS